MKSGIYYIKCLINNKFYIGSAIDVKSRIKRHFRDLKKGIHHSKHLQKAWNLYGEINFTNGIFEEISTTSNLLVREEYWINMLLTYKREFGFNIKQNPSSKLGFKHSNKTKLKISKNNFSKGKKYENSLRGSVTIYQYSIDGAFIKQWNSIKEPADVLKINHQNIHKCINGKRFIAGNFMWVKNYCGLKIPPYIKHKKVLQLNSNDEILNEFNSLSDVKKKHPDYTFQVIWAVCNGKRKSAYGYKWKYKN